MALSREEVEQIAKQVAVQISGQKCSCRNLNSIFLRAIENDIPHWGAPGSKDQLEMRDSLQTLAKECGFEKDSKGQWTAYPKQEEMLNKIGNFTIEREHDDGDLTIKISDGTKAVVTTEGKFFVETEL